MTTALTTSHTAAQRSPLRAVLGMNAVTSVSGGLVATLAPNTISELFDLTQTSADLVVRAVGIGPDRRSSR